MTRGIETLRKMMVPAGTNDQAIGVLAANCFGVALGKVARALFDVGAAFEQPAQTGLSRKDLLAAAPDPVLLVVLDAGDGRAGLMWIDPLLVNALIELMTGAPDKAVFREKRQPTLIDAALSRDFCCQILQAFVSELAGATGRVVLPELGYLRDETDIQKLEFTLENTRHLVLSGQVSFQGGLRGGALALALPADLWRVADTLSNTGSKAGLKVGPSSQLQTAMHKAPLALTARLDVVTMPVARAVELQKGDIIPISTAALSDLALLTKEGLTLFRGRLGQQDGKKAVLINPPAAVAGHITPQAITPSPPGTGVAETPALPDTLPDTALNTPATDEPLATAPPL